MAVHATLLTFFAEHASYDGCSTFWLKAIPELRGALAPNRRKLCHVLHVFLFILYLGQGVARLVDVLGSSKDSVDLVLLGITLY